MKKLSFLLLFLLVFFLKPASVFAEKINSFDVKIIAHKDGLMDVTETIDYDFGNLSRHGIYRYIPLYSKVGSLYRIIKIGNVDVERDGQVEKFNKSQEYEQARINIKIGDANRTITGDHVYKISYIVENGIGSNFPDHDEIYWNATGDKWPVPIEKASINIATDFGANSTNFICYTGYPGSKEANCSINGSAASTGLLSPGQGLTVVVVYPTGTFPKSILSKFPPSSIFEKIIVFIILNYGYIFTILNLILAPFLLSWYFVKKNKKRFGPPSVNFDTPMDENRQRIPPALAGTIDSARMDGKDVLATIFDLAIRKYIKLEQQARDTKLLGIFKEGPKQIITKLKEDNGELNSYEKILFIRLFKDGNTVDISTLLDFHWTYQKMEDEVFKLLVQKDYYVKNPKTQRGFIFLIGFFAFFTLNIILAFVLFFLVFKLNGRTPLGDEIDHKIDGLKHFLKGMGRNYSWQAEKFYIVEQMIPYAIALGYVNQFMEQLKIINPNYTPVWYVGYSGNFYDSYNGFYTTLSTSSSFSGTSGGGGAGGGGGGGGGGSW